MTAPASSRTLPSNDAVVSQIVTPTLLSFILHFHGGGGEEKKKNSNNNKTKQKTLLPLFHIQEQGPHLKSSEASADFH